MSLRSFPSIAILVALGLVVCGALMFTFCSGTTVTCVIDSSVLMTGNLFAFLTAFLFLFLATSSGKGSDPNLIRGSDSGRSIMFSSRELLQRIRLFLL